MKKSDFYRLINIVFLILIWVFLYLMININLFDSIAWILPYYFVILVTLTIANTIWGLVLWIKEGRLESWDKWSVKGKLGKIGLSISIIGFFSMIYILIRNGSFLIFKGNNN